jgi:hypothetical protein
MVKKKTYVGTPGAHILAAPELSYVQVLHVEREGLGQRVKTTAVTPGEPECMYVAGTGQLVFDAGLPFGGIPDPSGTTDIPTEKIFVIWKE